MTKKERNIGLLILTAIIILPMAASASHSSFVTPLQNFIPAVEGFSATPVWDVKQWSWGYGTAAGFDPDNKPKGTITREQAFIDMMKVINHNYNYLKNVITRPLNGNQWAALLSFSYNLGPGNADNLAPNINSGDDTALFAQWRKYVNAGGHYNQGSANRREKEIALWNS